MTTLLLNCYYEPVAVISWRRAISLLLSNRAELLEKYDNRIKSPRKEYEVPAVLKLTSRYKINANKVRFNRKNVYRRDNHTCQYCGRKYGEDFLTFDHVYPKSAGGTTVWTNIVTCCKDCNQKKNNRTPSQAGMKLLSNPKEPKFFMKLFMDEHDNDKWSFWLGFRNERRLS